MVGVVVADASVPGYRHIQDGQELSVGYMHIQDGEDLVVTRQQAKVLMFRLSLCKVHVRAPSQLRSLRSPPKSGAPSRPRPLRFPTRMICNNTVSRIDLDGKKFDRVNRG